MSPRVYIKDIIADRWLAAVQNMRSTNQSAEWEAELAEVEHILTEHRPFYWSLRPLIGIVSEWEHEWYNGTFKKNMDKRRLNAETRARFLNILVEMRDDKEFDRYFYELEELARIIEEEELLVYGLLRIKSIMDSE